MKCIPTSLEGVIIIEPDLFSDSRGYFYESFQEKRYKEYGIPEKFVQDNISHSVKDVVRGLHYQLHRPQGKLVFVLYGKVLDVIVDVRPDSKKFGQHIIIELSEENHRQVYIPPGYAHGFSVQSETAGFMYKCTDYYDPSSEKGIAWNDEALGIMWHVKQPILSLKDSRYPSLKDISRDELPA